MDYNELKTRYEELTLQIDTFHLFYEEFNSYDLAISNGNGLLAEMYSALLQVKKKSGEIKPIVEQEKRINELFSIFSLMQGLNNKCQNQKIKLRDMHITNHNLNHRLTKLTEELKAIKLAHNHE